jgi:tetratricopeptide (TPR) repeat protein
MGYSDHLPYLEKARQSFEDGHYEEAESQLQKVILINNRVPEAFVMLGTIFFDRGKFNKAIKSYKRALEIDPSYSDASVGLSIILNDLGKYEEGKAAFEKGQEALKQSKLRQEGQVETSLSESKVAIKHRELGDLYFQMKEYDEALDQYSRALASSLKKSEVVMSIVECHLALGDQKSAARELKNFSFEQPQFSPAKIKLGQIYYENDRIIEAIELWESVLMRDPENREALRLLRVAGKNGSRSSDLEL